jgi:hypothetical protein
MLTKTFTKKAARFCRRFVIFHVNYWIDSIYTYTNDLIEKDCIQPFKRFRFKSVKFHVYNFLTIRNYTFEEPDIPVHLHILNISKYQNNIAFHARLSPNITIIIDNAI